jgi:hypothetical protein
MMSNAMGRRMNQLRMENNILRIRRDAAKIDAAKIGDEITVQGVSMFVDEIDGNVLWCLDEDGDCHEVTRNSKKVC